MISPSTPELHHLPPIADPLLAITPSGSSDSSSASDTSTDQGFFMTSSVPARNGQQLTVPGRTSSDPILKSKKQSSRKSSEENGAPHHPIAEFLYQLTKMLEDDNDEVIEWSRARIKVHFPDRLEKEVLHKYFRHSKFASFQRQLNYFGFRKIAGKGKMSPCSYVNDAASSDIRSLLHIKRKTNGSAARKAIGAANAGTNRVYARPAEPNKITSCSNGPLTSTGLPQPLSAMRANAPSAGAITLALQENAIRAGLNHQSLQQKALGESFFFPSENSLSALSPGHNRQVGGFNLAQFNSQLNPVAYASMMSEGIGPSSTTSVLGASMAQNGMNCPATAAMNAALSSQSTNNMFESSSNLSSLVNQSVAAAAGPAAAAVRQLGGRVSNQNFNRLPSSTSFLTDNLSSASLTHLLGGNRVSSLLSLNGFLSRDPSLVDLMGATGAPSFPLGTIGFESSPLLEGAYPGITKSYIQ